MGKRIGERRGRRLFSTRSALFNTRSAGNNDSYETRNSIRMIRMKLVMKLVIRNRSGPKAKVRPLECHSGLSISGD